MSIRLVAIDVDGTLARSDGTIAAESIAAIERARARGVVVAIATGRPWIVAARTAELVGHVDHVVCSNGAVVAAWPGGHFERDVYLDDGLPEALVGELRARLPGVGIGFELERGVKAERGFAERLPPGIPMSAPLDDVLQVLPRRVRKMLVWHDDVPTERLTAAMSEAVGDRAQVLGSGRSYLEVAPHGLDKAAALSDLCMSLGIDAAEVLAFGDEVNDLGMLQWAGIGVAMANAVPEAKAVADRIAPSNDDHGVAQVLAELLAEMSDGLLGP